MMNDKTGIYLDNNCLYVSGKIDFQSAVRLWNESLPLMAECQSLLFDFSKVTYTNSSALALLIEWIKYAKQKAAHIQFQHLPTQLQSILTVAGVDKVLHEHF